MKELTDDEVEFLRSAHKEGKIDKKFLATRSDEELRDYISDCVVEENE